MEKAKRQCSNGLRLTAVSAIVGVASLLFVPANSFASGLLLGGNAPQSVQQGATVKGRVVDETGEPMIGVTVKVKGARP